VDKYSADGHVDCAFEFNDRGRGPKIEAHYAFGADALPSRLDVTGVDYLKAPVDEHFAVDGGRAHWKSTSEDGQTSSPGFYVSNSGVFGPETASLVQSLRGSQDSAAVYGAAGIKPAD
jgi:hypothetical protein